MKAVTPRVQRVHAEGKVIHCVRQLATAETRLAGPDGTLYAHATTTGLVFEIPGPVTINTGRWCDAYCGRRCASASTAQFCRCRLSACRARARSLPSHVVLAAVAVRTVAVLDAVFMTGSCIGFIRRE